ncbi:MAG: cytochrome c [Devosia sp.]|jgi:cytochrome c|nr:cytochrome c [Devosia sp.]
MRNICGAIAILAWSSTAMAGASTPVADPIADGKVLVDAYCSDCHVVGRTGESPLPIAPRFRDLHLRYDVEDLSEALVEGIVTAHEAMPEFEFDPIQAAAIIAYLKSLSEPDKNQ